MINLECIESIAVVTLTRPSSLNALDCNAYRSLAAIFGDLEKNPNVRAVMLTGAPREDGRACFCAGADLRDGTLEEGSKLARIAFGLIERLPKPVIAAIGGVAVGGGLELALTCDLRVIARSSRLGVPEINIGSMPRAGGTQRLPALIGEAEAKKLLFSGDLIDGDEAFRIGLATQVVPDGVMFVLRELSGRSTRDADHFLRRENLLNLSLLNSFCEFPQALSKHYSALQSLSSTDTLFTAVEFSKAFYRNGSADLLVDILGGEGTGTGGHSSQMSPMLELLPLLSELTSRGAMEDLYLVSSLIRPEDRPQWQQFFGLLVQQRAELDGQEHTMRPGSCWIQPPRIKHTVLGFSDDLELLEVIIPAQYDTVNMDEQSGIKPDPRR